MKKRLFFLMTSVVLVCIAKAQLLGIASNGGVGTGSIYSLNPSDLSVSRLYAFVDEETFHPRGNLMQASNGRLYGTTVGPNDRSGYGTLFTFDLGTTSLSIVHQFSGPDGSAPFGALIEGGNGKLYGLTYWDGEHGAGTLFCFDLSTAAFSKLYDFTEAEVGNTSQLHYTYIMMAKSGVIYGTTYAGGALHYGTLFSFDPSSGTYTLLHQFTRGMDGGNPFTALLETSDGKFYGTTQYGGTAGWGTIFSFDPSTSVLTSLYSFSDVAKGGNPVGNLIETGNGILYGMTGWGGTSNKGAVYSFDRVNNTVRSLQSITTNGSAPYSDFFAFLTLASNGMIYGNTGGNNNDFGSLFALDIAPALPVFTPVLNFNVQWTLGANPAGPLIEYKRRFYRDADNDGFGDPAQGTLAVAQPAGYVANNTDCNDAEATIFPGAAEVCDGKDNNCNGLVDEGFADTDHDGKANCVDDDDDGDGVPDDYDCAPLDPSNTQFLICHNGQAICVDRQGWENGHRKHGDYLGACDILGQRSAALAALATDDFSLACAPNPGHGAFEISYAVPVDCRVVIRVYDLLGREVKTLLNTASTPGSFRIRDASTKLRGGVYYVRLTATAGGKEFTRVQKMVRTE